MADYEIRLFTPNGEYLRTLPFRRLEYGLIENDVGALALAIHPNVGLSAFQRDAQIEVWRSANGRTYLEGSGGDGAVWLVKRARYESAGDVEALSITAYDAKCLLRQRFVVGAAGSAAASKTGAMDDMMREIVREALGDSAGSATGRTLSTWLTVEANDPVAPSVSKAFAHRSVLSVLQDIVQQSMQAGVYLSFDVIHSGRVFNSPVFLRFAVKAGQRGIDRGASTARRLVFSRRFGTLADMAVEYDWSEEVNAVTVGGSGEGSARRFASAEDYTRITRSPFGRSEGFVDQTSIDTVSILQSEANARLANGRPRLRITGTLAESSLARYGVHFNHGDIVTVEEGGIATSARLSAVRVAVDETGEKIEARVSTETVI